MEITAPPALASLPPYQRRFVDDLVGCSSGGQVFDLCEKHGRQGPREHWVCFAWSLAARYGACFGPIVHASLTSTEHGWKRHAHWVLENPHASAEVRHLLFQEYLDKALQASSPTGGAWIGEVLAAFIEAGYLHGSAPEAHALVERVLEPIPAYGFAQRFSATFQPVCALAGLAEEAMLRLVEQMQGRAGRESLVTARSTTPAVWLRLLEQMKQGEVGAGGLRVVSAIRRHLQSKPNPEVWHAMKALARAHDIPFDLALAAPPEEFGPLLLRLAQENPTAAVLALQGATPGQRAGLETSQLAELLRSPHAGLRSEAMRHSGSILISRQGPEGRPAAAARRRP